MTALTLPSTLIAAYLDIKNDNVDKVNVEVSQNGWPAGVRDMFGSEAADGPTVTFDQRIKRCYELAAYALVFGSAPSIGSLIHGSIHGPDAAERIGHAWLVIPNPIADLVWEPITAKVHLKDEWYEFSRARDERQYLKHVAQRIIHLRQDYGRWHESRYP